MDSKLCFKMEFNRDIALLQGSFISAESMYGPLNAESSNEHIQDASTVIIDVLSELKTSWQNQNYSDKEQDWRLRKIHLTMLLNTCFPTLEKLVQENSDFECMCDALVPVSPKLYFHITHRGFLWTYMCESILLLPETTSQEIIKEYIRSAAVVRNSIDVYNMEKVLETCFCKACESVTNVASCNTDSVCGSTDSVTGTHLWQSFQQLINIFTKPNKDHLNSLEANELLEFAGHVFLCSLFLLQKSLRKIGFQTKYDVAKSLKLKESLHILETLKEETLVNIDSEMQAAIIGNLGSKIKLKSLPEGMETCIMEMIKFCKDNIESINVNVWMFWAECNSLESNITLQSSITTASYNGITCLQEFIENAECSDSLKAAAAELAGMLSNFAQKPSDEMDGCDKMDIQSIVQKVNLRNEYSCQWFCVFVKHADLYSSEESVTCLERNLDLMEEKSVFILIERTLTLVQGEASKDLKERAKQITLACVITFPYELQSQVLNWYMEKYGVCNSLMLQGFSQTLTDILNRAVQSEKQGGKERTQYIWLCLQSSGDTVTRVMQQAVENEGQVVLMSEILTILKAACCRTRLQPHSSSDDQEIKGTSLVAEDMPAFKPTLLSSVITHMTTGGGLCEQKQKNLKQLLKILIPQSIIKVDEVLHSVVLPDLIRTLQKRDLRYLKFILELFQVCMAEIPAHLMHESDVLNPCVALFCLAQILEECQLKFAKEVSATVMIRELALESLSFLVDKIIEEGGSFSEKEVLWLHHQVSEFSPATLQYYLLGLFQSFDIVVPSPTTPEEVLWYRSRCGYISAEEPDVLQQWAHLGGDYESCVLGLQRVLPELIPGEWLTLARFLKFIVLSGAVDVPLPAGFSAPPGISMCKLLCDGFLLLILSTAEDENKRYTPDVALLDHCLRLLGALIKDEVVDMLKLDSASMERKMECVVVVFQWLCHLVTQLPVATHDTVAVVLLAILTEVTALTSDRKAEVCDGAEDTKKVQEQKSKNIEDSVLYDFTASVCLLPPSELQKVLARKILSCVME